MLEDYVMATIMSQLGPEEAQRYQQALQNGEILPPEKIQKYLSKDYKDIAEVTAYHSLNYLKNKLNVVHEFYKGWKDALIAGEEIYYVGIIMVILIQNELILFTLVMTRAQTQNSFMTLIGVAVR